MQLPRLSKLSFGLAALTALLTAGLILADDPPKWDPAPGNSTVFTGRACTDKTGQAPCNYTVGTCYAVGANIVNPPPRNAINGTAVKSVKAKKAYPWGVCLSAGANPDDTCTQYPYLECMDFEAYSLANCVNLIVDADEKAIITTLCVPKACRPNVIIVVVPPLE